MNRHHAIAVLVTGALLLVSSAASAVADLSNHSGDNEEHARTTHTVAWTEGCIIFTVEYELTPQELSNDRAVQRRSEIEQLEYAKVRRKLKRTTRHYLRNDDTEMANSLALDIALLRERRRELEDARTELIFTNPEQREQQVLQMDRQELRWERNRLFRLLNQYDDPDKVEPLKRDRALLDARLRWYGQEGLDSILADTEQRREEIRQMNERESRMELYRISYFRRAYGHRDQETAAALRKDFKRLMKQMHRFQRDRSELNTRSLIFIPRRNEST